MTKKLELKQKDAIRECKEIWETVFDGRAKDKWEANRLRGNRPSYCPLCKYDSQFADKKSCAHCSLVKQFDITCSERGTDFLENPKKFAALVMKLKER